MILRICIAIPAFDNPTTIAQVVADALRLTKFPILVVDDGSRDPVLRVLQRDAVAAQALEAGRLRVLRSEQNRGKGQALRLAIEDCVALGFTHLLSVDGDGQHPLTEALKIAELGRDHPWDLIIGHRRMQAATVPPSSRFGRAFSNFWVRYETEVAVRDSQSGLRLYPLFHLQSMSFFTRRYEFEAEVLIRLLWKGVQIRELDVDVNYPEGTSRITHFRLVRDNARIVTVNTGFVLLSLLRKHQAPRQVGLSTGLGVLIGCTPLFGLHTALALLTAFALRLNAVYLVLGSNISIPPLAPFIALTSLAAGAVLSGDDFGAVAEVSPARVLELAANSMYLWTIGSLVVGTILGALLGGAAYLLARRVQRGAPRRSNWSGKSRGSSLGFGILKWVLRHFGLRTGYAVLLLIVVPYFFCFAPRARRALAEYWSIVRPRASWSQRVGLTLRHLYRFGQVLMDRAFVISRADHGFHAVPHGKQHIEAVMDDKRGAILLTAHVGGWDLAASMLSERVLEQPVHMVQFEAEGLTFNKVIRDPSERYVRIVDSSDNQSIFALHKLLAARQNLGLMGDRPLSHRYELVQFFGRLAIFDVTPYRLAAATGVPLLPVFGFKGQGHRYDFHVEPAQLLSYPKTGDRAITCKQWAQQFAAVLERHLRSYPDQWFNFYSFWSAPPTRPGEFSRSAAGELDVGPGRNQWLEELTDCAAELRPPAIQAPDWAPDRTASGAR